nr:hypothetical protein [Tanacetum cinerariifolium]
RGTGAAQHRAHRPPHRLRNRGGPHAGARAARPHPAPPAGAGAAPRLRAHRPRGARPGAGSHPRCRTARPRAGRSRCPPPARRGRPRRGRWPAARARSI